MQIVDNPHTTHIKQIFAQAPIPSTAAPFCQVTIDEISHPQILIFNSESVAKKFDVVSIDADGNVAHD
jgi:hypothetical protein